MVVTTLSYETLHYFMCVLICTVHVSNVNGSDHAECILAVQYRAWYTFA